MIQFRILGFLFAAISIAMILSPTNIFAELIRGTNGDDDINGTEGDDTLLLGPGDDSGEADEGDDVVKGQEGNDLLIGDDDNIGDGTGSDRLLGGPGNDILLHNNSDEDETVSDGFKDILDCGPGDDEAWINEGTDHDEVKNCETVHTEND